MCMSGSWFSSSITAINFSSMSNITSNLNSGITTGRISNSSPEVVQRSTPDFLSVCFHDVSGISLQQRDKKSTEQRTSVRWPQGQDTTNINTQANAKLPILVFSAVLWLMRRLGLELVARLATSAPCPQVLLAAPSVCHICLS